MPPAPAVTEPDEAEDVDPALTEIVKLSADRVDGVGSPANGIPFLLMKAISDPVYDPDNPSGSDGKPGYDPSKAADTSVQQSGCDGSCCAVCGERMGLPLASRTGPSHTAGAVKDVQVPADDAGWQAVADAEDGAWSKILAANLVVGDPKVAKAHRDFTMEERRDLAKRGQALADGSYPIPDRDALRRAAILARSGHGNVSAAKALIARRAREMGVTNPLEKGPKKNKGPKNRKVGKSAAEPGATAPQTPEGDMDVNGEYATRDEVREIVKAAVAEANAPVTEWMAKVRQQPVASGPATAAAPRPAAPEGGPTRDELVQKAARYRQQAQECAEPAMAADYRQMAAEAEEQAARLAPPAN